MDRPQTSPGTDPRGHGRVRHHKDVSGCLERLRARLRRTLLLEGACAVTAAGASLMVGLVALDNLLHLRQETRLVLLSVAVLLLAAAAVYWLFLRPGTIPGDEDCALLVERGKPELENRLINTVSFDRTCDRERRAGLDAAVMHLIEEEAVAKLKSIPQGELFKLRARRRPAACAGLALLIVGAYALVWPRYFQNALARFSSPFSHVAPVTDTFLEILPGDAEIEAGESLSVVATARGRLPERAIIHLSYGAAPRMDFDGRSFSYRVERPSADFTYRVTAGDAESRTFNVAVRRPPEVRELDVRVVSPPCTGWPQRLEKRSAGNVAALEGSELTLEVRTRPPAAEGSLMIRAGGERSLETTKEGVLRATLRLIEDMEYGFFFVGEDGTSTSDLAYSRKLTALPDRPPSCEIVQPGRDRDLVVSGGAGLPVTLRLLDDVGLRDAAIFVAFAPAGGRQAAAEPRVSPRRDSAGEWLEMARLDGFEGQKEAVPSVRLDLEAAFRRLAPPGEDSATPLEPGDLLYRACAIDLCGKQGCSRVFRVRRLDGSQAADRQRREMEELRATLSEALRRERALRGGTRGALETTRRGDFAERATSLSREQEAIRKLCVGALERRESVPTRATRRRVTQAARELMPSVARSLAGSALVDPDRRPGFLEEALRGERRIIAILAQALGLLDAAFEQGEEDPEGRGGTTPGRIRGAEESLRKLIADLKDFVRQQKQVIARTREIDDVEPEDFTAEEKEALQELAALEEKWGRYLEEKGTDLSKVAPQDMSLGSLAEEVVELVEEIDLAKDYLEGGNIELAVPAEQAGVALAEEIEMNIERWLLRDRDRLRWVMEEPTAEFDLPLADLPAELEDIIGELIDREELMSQETEDVTSSWLDSLDDGIGWDAMDGPISSMNAKGVTGNLQPNDMEIGGRAGEGRSGKSHGQFVEETAAGKGGRQTPTRSTPDPFEAGEVKDRGQDPTGGSTGGGKLAGAGEEGLRGKPSPELSRAMGALAERQTRIRQEGERLNVALRRRRYYPQNLDRAIELMKAMEEALTAGGPYRYETLRRRIVSELRATRELIASQLDHKMRSNLSAPPALEEELLDAGGEELPAEYRDLIRDYYRSLAGTEGGGAKP